MVWLASHVVVYILLAVHLNPSYLSALSLPSQPSALLLPFWRRNHVGRNSPSVDSNDGVVETINSTASFLEAFNASIRSHSPNITAIIPRQRITMHRVKLDSRQALKYAKSLESINILNSTEKIFSSLVSIDISHNSIDALGFRTLMTLLSHCTQLTHFACDGNTLDNLSLQSIVYALCSPSSSSSSSSSSALTHVSFNHCRLTDESIPHIIRLLKANPQLQSLSLSMNEITADGVSLLFNIFKKNACSQLQSLDISYNPIGELGTERDDSLKPFF